MDCPGEKQATTKESALTVKKSVSKDYFVVKHIQIDCMLCFSLVLTEIYSVLCIFAHVAPVIIVKCANVFLGLFREGVYCSCQFWGGSTWTMVNSEYT